MGHLSWIGVGQILFEFLLSLVLYELLWAGQCSPAYPNTTTEPRLKPYI
jgi:hypothetical protein